MADSHNWRLAYHLFGVDHPRSVRIKYHNRVIKDGKMNWLIILLICVGTYRITRLFAVDALPLIAKPREWIVNKLGEEHAISYLVTCMWCVSMYVGAGLTAVTDLFTAVPYPWLTWIVASAVTGIIAQREPEE